MNSIEEYMIKNRTIAQPHLKDNESFFLSEKLNPISLAESYVISADYLIESSKDDEMEPIIIWPVLFLYRHSVELFIKNALTKLKLKFKGHDITTLYYALEEGLKGLENKYSEKLQDIPNKTLFPNEEEFFSIMEFHSISPRSTELRFQDSDLIGGDSHMLCGNYINAQFHARRAAGYFDLLDQKISYLLS